MDADFSYDVVPYPSLTFPQTHPDRLATLATLYGLQPAPVEKCRVLELGCGDGTNLISHAYGLPESDFTGVDLSARHIADASKSAAELNLSNVKFVHANILEIDREKFGAFDYIIAHGLFSWIPEVARAGLWRIYQTMLAPGGIGYISYNALPGCHVRLALREMMQFHVAAIDEPAEKVRRGLNLLNFVGEAAEADSLYQKLLRAEFGAMLERSAENIFHDDFSDFNQPFYFHEFIAQAERHGLQFVSEADAFATNSRSFPPKTRAALDALSGDDVIKREQYTDFIKFRRFRQTLLCRRELKIKRQPKAEVLSEFYVASAAKHISEKPKLSKKTPEKFVGAKGANVETDHPLTKAALVHLGKIWARSIRFGELMEKAREMLLAEGVAAEKIDRDFAENAETTASFLLQIFGTGLVKFHVHAPAFAAGLSERPQASRLARWQAARGNENVTTLHNLNLKLDDNFVRFLMILLDGTRNRAEIFNAFKNEIEAGELGAEIADKAAFARELPEFIENNLARLLENGLLEK